MSIDTSADGIAWSPYFTPDDEIHMFHAVQFLTSEIGRAEDVLSLFSSYGLNAPNREAVDKWYRRGSVPSEWFVRILCVLELDRGSPVRLANYLKAGDAA